MEREVIGMTGDKCKYVEQMPGDMEMVCEYTEDMRNAMADMYELLDSGASMGTSSSTDMGAGETTTTYTIDGKEVENPLEEAINSGQCTIPTY